MSCTSPVIFTTGVTASYPYTAVVAGSFELYGYALPGVTTHGWAWNPAHFGNCTSWENGATCQSWTWGGWQNTVVECNGWNTICATYAWVPGSSSPCCYTTTPSIPLWPTLFFNFSASMNQVYEATQAVNVTPTGGVVPIEATSVQLNDFNLDINVGPNAPPATNSTNITLSVPCTITLTQQNGTFNATVLIGTLVETYTADGLVYAATITINLLFCATPIPPQTWINLQLAVSFTVAYSSDVGVDLLAKPVSFVVVLPLADE